MTTGYLGKHTNDWHDNTNAKTQHERESMWGPMPGEVVSFDPATQTATIQPLYKPVHDGQSVTMPQLFEVPVDLPRTVTGAITTKIAPGTKVMLTPMMRSMENYDTEQDGTPSDRRSFNLSDMRASITGGNSVADPLPNYDPDNTHIRFDPAGNFGIKGSEDGKFKLEGSQGNIYQLYNDAVDECQKVCDALKTEPALVHIPVYAAAASALATILGKLRSMEL